MILRSSYLTSFAVSAWHETNADLGKLQDTVRFYLDFLQLPIGNRILSNSKIPEALRLLGVSFGPEEMSNNAHSVILIVDDIMVPRAISALFPFTMKMFKGLTKISSQIHRRCAEATVFASWIEQ